MAASTVGWFSIQGKNHTKLISFYKKAFNWKKTMPLPDGGQMIPAGKDGIPGGIGPSRDGKSSVSVYINVTNIGAQLKKIAAAGGKVAMPETELPNNMGSIAGFIDPAGNWTGIWAPPKAAKKKAKKRAKKKAAKKKTARKKAAKKAARRPAKKKAARRRSARR